MKKIAPIWNAPSVPASAIPQLVEQVDVDRAQAEVPAIPGCATQGESFEDLLQNLYEAVEGCPSVDLDASATSSGNQRVIEIAG